MSMQGALAIDTRPPSTPTPPSPWRVTLFHGPYASLVAVELHGPPVASMLQTLCAGLVALEIGIVDSATKITQRGLFQRFELSEPNGGPLTGRRRDEVLTLFHKTLGMAPQPAAVFA